MTLLTLFASSAPVYTGWITPKDANGWTTFSPSGDSRTIYCSSSTGNDANSGLAENVPKQTIAAAEALMRDGYPDHIYLKRGDTWTNETFSIWQDTAGGRSETEPWYIGAYGTGARPKLQSSAASNYIFRTITHSASYVVIANLHLEAINRGSGDSPVGISTSCSAPGGVWAEYLCFEGLLIDGFGGGIVAGGFHHYVTIRRNVIINTYRKDGGHSQGLYSDNMDGLLIEENVFDHNGWLEGAKGLSNVEGGNTIFNHNMYITHNSRNVTIQNNFSSRASSMGLKFQPTGGTHYVTNNVFVRNGYASQIGGGAAADQAGKTGATIYAEDNVFIEGDVTLSSGGMGVTVSNINAGTFSRNIIANKLGTGVQFALSLQDGMGWESIGWGVRNFELRDNRIYNWRGRTYVWEPTATYGGGPLPVMENIDFIDNDWQEPDLGNTELLVDIYSASSSVNSFAGGRYFRKASGNPFDIDGVTKTYAQWVSDTGETGSTYDDLQTDDPGTDLFNTYLDPTRTVTAYATSLGYSDYEDFISELKLLGKGVGDISKLTPSINDWIRAGFNMAALGGGGAWKPAGGSPPSGSGFGNISFDGITYRLSGEIRIEPTSPGAAIFALAATANEFNCYGEGTIAYGDGVRAYSSLVPV